MRSALGEVARAVHVLDDANGQALRVYVRVFNGEVQYVLALRASTGRPRLVAWRSYPSEPTLSWTARPIAAGWLLEGAELR